MAVANVAEILAETYNVIVCDWDLEAPGLEAYFASNTEETEKWRAWPGTMDLIEEYRATLSKPKDGRILKDEAEASGGKFMSVGSLRLRRPSTYVHNVDTKSRRQGSIGVLTSGQRDGSNYHRYIELVQDFHWSDFYENWAGGSYLEFYRKSLDDSADLVLIDSRTGVTEHGGVCTHHLADLVVLLTATNEGSLQGILEIANDLRALSSQEVRNGRPILLLPVAARVEREAEKEALRRFETRFERVFLPFVPKEVGDPEAFLLDAQIPYIPYYSFADRIAAREPENERHRDLYRAYEKLAKAIIAVGVANRYLESGEKPPIEAPQRDFFISYNQLDSGWAEWIAWQLEEAGYSVVTQAWDFRPGTNFVSEMQRTAELAERTVLVLSPNLLAAPLTSPEWAAAFKNDLTGKQGRLVPVRVAECNVEGLLGRTAYIDLVGLDDAAATDELLRGVRWERAKSQTLPAYPGLVVAAGRPTATAPKPPFPTPAGEPALATHNLRPANPDFVGREQVLAELRRLLTSGQGPAVLTGLGGIGKTQTALAYCYRHLADYELIWWLHAETAATLAADFTTLAAPLGLDPATADQAKLIASIRDALQASAGWLLVFDYVEEPGLLRDFLPSTGKGHALITSRRRDWQGLARALLLKVMEEDEALQLLTGRSDPEALPADKLAEAKALAKELGYLPLALAQARAYMAETGRSLAGYRRLLQSSRPAVLARGRASPDYPASVARTWQISIEAAAGACAAARPLLELLAFFSADPLPMAVLGAEPAALPEGLRGELERDEAIAALHRFSLIRAEAGSIAVHRLVQDAIRDELDGATAKARAETAVRLVNAALPRPPQEHTNWPAIEALLPHALAAAAAAERLGASLEDTATVLNQAALYHYSRATYAAAEPLFKRAIAIGEKALDPEHPAVVTFLNNLALLYQATGRFREAEPRYERALAIFEEALGAEHPYVAISLNNLAGLYRLTERYAEAEPLYKRAIAIDEKALGPEHPSLATDLNNLAALCRATGRYAEAEPLYQRALTILAKTLPPEHPDLMRVQENYARLLEQLGRQDESAALRAQAQASRDDSPTGHQHGPGLET